MANKPATYTATAPDGTRFAIKTKREIGFAVFLKLANGKYHPQFAKTMDAARRVWGVRGVGYTRAIKETENA